MRPIIDDCIFLDFETAITKDYKLGPKMSTRAYVTDPRFDILTVSFAVGDGPILFFHKHDREGGSLAAARAMLDIEARNGRWLVAHNTNFDGLVLSLAWQLRFERVFDTTAYLRHLGLGAALANGARMMGLHKLDAPPFTEESLLDPAKLTDIAKYNMKDTLIARRLFARALGDTGFPDIEFSIVSSSCVENINGLGIDRAGARGLAERIVAARDERLAAFCSDYPTFDTTSINNPAKVRGFAMEKFDVQLSKLKKKTAEIAQAMAGNKEFAKFFRDRDAILMRERWAKKLFTISDGAERIHGYLRAFGSHTGRFSAGGSDSERVNIHSMPKGDSAEFPELAEYRHILQADPDESFIAGDSKTIEPRVLAWLAREVPLLDGFARGLDIYVDFGGRAFPGQTIDKPLRAVCKEAVLGLGFAQSAKGFHNTLLGKGFDTPLSDAARLHGLYHATFPNIVALWSAYWRSFTKAFEHGTAWVVKDTCCFRRITEVAPWGHTIEIDLPTGRKLYYRSVMKTWEPIFDGKCGWRYWYAEGLRFDPFDPKQKAARGGKAKKGRKFPDGQVRYELGRQVIVENIVQAVARDILMAQALDVDAHPDLRVRFHVHDEIVASSRRCKCPRRDEPLCGQALGAMHEPECPWIKGRGILAGMMSRVPACLRRLADVPVAVELSDAVRDHYGK